MSGFAKFTMLGNLGSAPKMIISSNNKAITTISVCETYESVDKNTGEEKKDVQFHQVTFFGKKAEVVAKHFNKGSRIFVEGHIKEDEYEKEGVKHYPTKFIGTNFEFCEKAPS